MKKWLVLLVTGIISIQPGFAQEEEGSAFSSEDFNLDVPAIELKIDVAKPTPAVNQNWDFNGFLQMEGGYSFAKENEESALSKLRATLNLSFDYKFSPDWKIKLNGNGFYDLAYRINGRDEYNQETLDVFEQEIELRDSYILGDLGSGFSIKAGRQIIAWGASDFSQINDMANPRDNREMGMVELEDSRIPVAASLLSWSQKSWRIEAAAIHEYRPNKIAPEGSEFDPLTLKRDEVIFNEEELPSSGEEWVARIQKSFNGGDIGFYTSETYNDAFYIDFYSLAMANGQPNLTVTQKHQKISSFGISANKVIDSLLIKGEMAHKDGMIFQRSDVNDQIQNLVQSGSLPAGGLWDEQSQAISMYLEKDQIQHMLGIEYMGISDLTLTLEVNRNHISHWEDTLATTENTYSTFSSATHQSLNDTLTNRLVWIHFTDQEGDLYRWTMDYDVFDGLNVSGGVVLYESPKSDSLLEPYKNNDRLTLSSRYSF